MLIIYDAMNYLRVRLETGSTISQIIQEHAHQTSIGEIPVWVWDGFNGNARRRELYPEYKLKRQKPKPEIFQNLKTIKEWLRYTNCYQIEVDGYEGDDVIYSLVEDWKDRCKIYIQSTDKDLRQMYGENVSGNANPLKGHGGEIVPDEYLRLHKALVGDPSDNIKGIPRFGLKAFDTCNAENILYKFQRGCFQLDPETDGVKEAHAEWAKENTELLETMWRIVGFFHIERPSLVQNMHKYEHNPEALEGIFKQFFM